MTFLTFYRSTKKSFSKQEKTRLRLPFSMSSEIFKITSHVKKSPSLACAKVNTDVESGMHIRNVLNYFPADPHLMCARGEIEFLAPLRTTRVVRNFPGNFLMKSCFTKRLFCLCCVLKNMCARLEKSLENGSKMQFIFNALSERT